MEQTTALNRIQTSQGAGPWREALGSPLILGLAALFGVQIIAAIGLWNVGRGVLDTAVLDQPLLDFEPAGIGVIQIQGADGAPLILTRTDQGWVISGLADFPADGSKVDGLIGTLAGLKRPLPLGTSPEALERHKVADDGFERQVILESGGEPVATLLLGDSPGFRRVYGRAAGELAVYDLELPLFDVSDRPDDWLARDNLHLGRERMERVSAGDWVLIKDESGWQLEGDANPTDQVAVDALLDRIAHLGYRGILGTESSPDYDQDNPILELEVALTDGTTRAYRVSQAKDSEDFVLKVSDRPWYFKLSEFDLEGLLDLERDKFVGKEKAPDSAGAK